MGRLLVLVPTPVEPGGQDLGSLARHLLMARAGRVGIRLAHGQHQRLAVSRRGAGIHRHGRAEGQADPVAITLPQRGGMVNA